MLHYHIWESNCKKLITGWFFSCSPVKLSTGAWIPLSSCPLGEHYLKLGSISSWQLASSSLFPYYALEYPRNYLLQELTAVFTALPLLIPSSAEALSLPGVPVLANTGLMCSYVCVEALSDVLRLLHLFFHWVNVMLLVLAWFQLVPSSRNVCSP